MPKDLSHRIKTTIIKEQRLLIAVAIAVLLFNIPYGQFLLYPFMIFGRWIHELCKFPSEHERNIHCLYS